MIRRLPVQDDTWSDWKPEEWSISARRVGCNEAVVRIHWSGSWSTAATTTTDGLSGNDATTQPALFDEIGVSATEHFGVVVGTLLFAIALPRTISRTLVATHGVGASGAGIVL